MRLALFILAYNLGNLLRRLGLPKAINDWTLRSVQVKLVKKGDGWYPIPEGWCSSLGGWPCREFNFQGVLDRIGWLCPAPG